MTPQILVDTVDEMLILQRGRELGYKLGDDQFKEVLDRIKKDNKIENDEQFEAALKQENMTLADLRKSIEQKMIVTRVQQNEVMGKISVTEEEARRYYDAHQNEFMTPASLMIREMLVAVPADPKGTLNVGKDDEAKAKAEALRARVAGGESFEKLAARRQRRAVEGQRRPDRPDQARGAGAGAAEALRADEARRRHARHPHVARLPVLQARVEDRPGGGCRSTRRASRSPTRWRRPSSAASSRSSSRRSAPRRSSSGRTPS